MRYTSLGILGYLVMHILAGYLWRGIFGQQHLGWPTVRGTLDTILAAPPPDTTTTKKKRFRSTSPIGLHNYASNTRHHLRHSWQLRQIDHDPFIDLRDPDLPQRDGVQDLSSSTDPKSGRAEFFMRRGQGVSYAIEENSLFRGGHTYHFVPKYKEDLY